MTRNGATLRQAPGGGRGRAPRDSPHDVAGAGAGALRAIPVLAAVYVATRYVAYAALHVDSTYATRPLATLAWTVAMGAWIGAMYVLVGRRTARGGDLGGALSFGGLVFGVNWVVFNLFALLFIRVPVMDLLVRSSLDAAAAGLGAWLLSLRLPRRATRAPAATG